MFTKQFKPRIHFQIIATFIRGLFSFCGSNRTRKYKAIKKCQLTLSGSVFP
jgi:hypothetical protein